MKKIIITILLTSLLALSLTACKKDDGKDVAKQDVAGDIEDKDQTDTSLEYILNKGELILGLDDSFPPMGFRDDDDNIVGFDIDLAQAVCDKLGVELVLQPINWEAKEHELGTKSIDCIWNGFSITPDRQENLTLSIPYMENKIAIIVLNDSDIKSIDDMAGKSVAVQGSSSAEEALYSDKNKDFRESLGNINSSFQDYITALMDLETGNSDAVLMDSVVAKYMIHVAGKDYRMLDDTLNAEDYAIGFRKGEEVLAEAINKALRELKKEGTVEQIATKWFGSDITIIE